MKHLTDHADGFPNFSGTSAAAPNAAAVAAMMKQLDPRLSAARIIDIPQATAIDMPESGDDPATGHGRRLAAPRAGCAISI